MCEARINKLNIANRSLEKAENLVQLLGQKTGFDKATAFLSADCDGSDADMIINSTSLGLKEIDPLPLPLNNLKKDTVIADLL